VLDIRKAETPVDVLLAAAVISTLNFAFEISTDGVPRAATSTNKRAAYRMRAAKLAGAHTAEIVSSLDIVSSIRYSLFRYDT
jgi:hypothetical protein